ncbi:unnamed protein product [Dibothriocephalus latus]|uniref:BPTI/Kunitz inhibitor domain-containing protein n=1 Tax=Dibothriocephalus latus TaxID=60516 RepID=A0A3P7LHN5_DIBLA|nr:unnamed protein product [Dibothriocephalus latus]
MKLIIVLFLAVLVLVGSSEGKRTWKQTIDPGKCKAAITMYGYNSKTHRFEKFIYGGCGGNKNRFDTLEKCQKNVLANRKSIKEGARLMLQCMATAVKHVAVRNSSTVVAVATKTGLDPCKNVKRNAKRNDMVDIIDFKNL